MAGIYSFFQKKVFKRTALFPVWVPGSGLSLGDIVCYKDNIYQRQGNIDDLNVESLRLNEPKTDLARKNTISIVENGQTILKNKVETKVTTEILPFSAGFDVSFDKGNSFFLSASDLTYSRISDQISLSKDLINYYKQPGNDWHNSYYLVTDVIKSKNCIIILKAGNATKVSISASAEATTIELPISNIEVSFESTTSGDIQEVYNLTEETVILFKVKKLYRRLFRDPLFKSKIESSNNLNSQHYTFDEFRSPAYWELEKDIEMPTS